MEVLDRRKKSAFAIIVISIDDIHQTLNDIAIILNITQRSGVVVKDFPEKSFSCGSVWSGGHALFVLVRFLACD